MNRKVLTSWATTTNFIGFLLLPRFRASLGASMQALGYATFAYKLVGFVIAGVVAGLAGALLANQTAYVSPATTPAITKPTSL